MVHQPSCKIEPKIQEAVNAYKCNQNQKITKIARELQVPYNRLHRRIHRSSSKLSKQPVNYLLNEHQEGLLRDWIFQQDDTCLVPNAKEIRDRANAILAQSHTDSTKPPLQVGKMWAYHFIQRLPPQFRCRGPNPVGSKDVAKWPELEQALYEWILQEREQKKKVSGDIIYRKAEQMWPVVYPEKGGTTTPTFTSLWLRRFISRRLKGLNVEVAGDDADTAISTEMDQAIPVSQDDNQVSLGEHEESEIIDNNQNAPPQVSAGPETTPHQDDIPLISPAEALEALCTLRLYEEQQPAGNLQVIQALNHHKRVILQRKQQQQQSGI